VQRARLIDQLRVDGGEGSRLVLVAAPAGFGKTTLLAQWLAAEASQRRVAWLALDPGDADLRTFLTHLVAAIQTAEPDVGVDALALLEAGGTAPTDAVLVSLINDLDVLAGPTVVAFDDYHVIDGAAVHEAVTFLLDNLPPQVTLAMTTRADPPLPLSRLRARGELVEVRAADLRFTTDEAQVFLNEVMGWGWSRHSWRRWRRAPRGGRRGYSWLPCQPGPMLAPLRARGTSLGSSRPSREAIGSSSTTWLRRFWPGSRKRYEGSCSTPPCSTR
jgi:ATP/maltotriose-dependent transcriptional regulator MalT